MVDAVRPRWHVLSLGKYLRSHPVGDLKDIHLQRGAFANVGASHRVVYEYAT
jgi:hypothetical protein